MKKKLLFISLIFGITILNLTNLLAAIDPQPIETMTVKYLNSPIIIDGIADAAYPDYFELTYVLTFTPGQYSGPIDHSVKMKMGWRNEGIYIFADVSDDYSQGDLNWDQDGIELKIDPDTSDDGPDHLWQEDALEIGIESMVDTMYRYYNPTLGYGAARNGEIAAVGPRAGQQGVTFKIIRTGTSYTIEALIPWLFILPVGTTEDQVPSWIQKSMGFDIHAADNDGSGRDHSLVWDWDGSGTDADQSNINTLLLGYISFEQHTATIVNKVPDILFYPNPTGGKVNFENLYGVTSLAILDILGQQVLNIDTNSNSMSVDFQDKIKPGCYFILMKDRNENIISVNKLIVR